MTMKMIALAIVFMARAPQRVAGAGPENQLTQAPVCAGVDKATCEEKNSAQSNKGASLLQVNIGEHSQANANDDEQCNWQCYLDRYPGLEKVCSRGKNMIGCARKHWTTHGSKEGRDCTCPTFQQFSDTCPFLNTDEGENGTVTGLFPEGDGTSPLAIYLQGTTMPYGHPMSVAMLEQMAQRGFVAVNIHYSNMKYPGGDCQVWKGKASNVASCVDYLCENNKKVDCSKGLAVWGYSQGGQVSSLVGNYTKHMVTAQFGMSSSIMSHGYTKDGITWADAQSECLKLKVPRNKRRILIGDKDGHFGGNGKTGSGETEDVIAMCQLALGLQPSDCPNETPQMHCIQDDGSGYYVATESETGAFMSHFWFLGLEYVPAPHISGLSTAFTNPPNYYDPWGAKATFDWLAGTARV